MHKVLCSLYREILRSIQYCSLYLLAKVLFLYIHCYQLYIALLPFPIDFRITQSL